MTQPSDAPRPPSPPGKHRWFHNPPILMLAVVLSVVVVVVSSPVIGSIFLPSPPKTCEGIGGGGGSTPYELAMTPTSNSGSGTTWQDVLSISRTDGLQTGCFGLKVTASNGTTFPTEDARGSGCTVIGDTNGVSSCLGTSGGWYGVLLDNSSHDIVAIYSGSSPGWSYVSGSSIGLTNGDTLVVVTSILVAGNEYTLSAYSTDSVAVSGTTVL